MSDTIQYIVFGTGDPSLVAIKGDDNTFTGTNTFNVLNGTIGTVTKSLTCGTLIGTDGTISTSLTVGTLIGTVGTVLTSLICGTVNGTAFENNGTAGVDGTVAIQDLGTITHTLIFTGGLLSSYGTA